VQCWLPCHENITLVPNKIQGTFREGTQGPSEEVLYGAKVSVYSDGEGWNEPLKFVYLDGDTVVIRTTSGLKIEYRSTVVKPWVPDEIDTKHSKESNDKNFSAMFVEIDCLQLYE
jgi:hypothetical protein